MARTIVSSRLRLDLSPVFPLRDAHIEGDATMKGVLSTAKQYARELGPKEVVIEGAKGTTGANPGHVPRPIVVKVEE